MSINIFHYCCSYGSMLCGKKVRISCAYLVCLYVGFDLPRVLMFPLIHTGDECVHIETSLHLAPILLSGLHFNIYGI